MASSTGALVDQFGSFGVSLFIFDRSALKEESDKIEDAVKYYYPKEDFRLVSSQHQIVRTTMSLSG